MGFNSGFKGLNLELV